MTPERYDQIQKSFLLARSLGPADRATYLSEIGEGDWELRSEVESLLESSHNQKVSAMVDALGRQITAEAAALLDKNSALVDEHPRRIDSYDIVQVIGQGGMGVVYEAAQENPRRTVALKMMRPGLGGGNMLRRFKKETELLGQLQHPGIACIFEAGIGEVQGSDGRFLRKQPYYAMEYVRGEALNTYCSGLNLSMRARMELMARIAEAVQHAHEKGVIHRDLKPANILIDAQGQPKILDFGIARATNADMQTITLQTDVGQLVGTVPYMSPEQVAGDSRHLDARTDVYSLGVILYEILAGRLPLDVRNRSIPEAARIIREDDPSRLSSINTRLRGDIETIVAKALEKDKMRRYASAADFAADIRRYLRDEPLQARPAGTFYQWQKFSKRHKGLVGGIAATISALILGTIFSVRFALRERDQSVIAQRNELAAQRQAYRASLVAAEAALRASDVADADRQLAASPVSQRGWEWQHFHSRIDQSLMSIEIGEHSSRATVRFTSDGENLIALQAPSDVKGRAIRPMHILKCTPWTGVISKVRDVSSSFDRLLTREGSQFVSCQPGMYTIEDTLTGERQAGVESNNIGNREYLLGSTQDGGHVMISSRTFGGVVVFDTRTKQELCQIRGEWPWETSVDGSLVTACTKNGNVAVYESATGRLMKEFSVSASQLSSVAITTDNQTLMTGDFDGIVRCFSLTTGLAMPIQCSLGSRIHALAMNPSGTLLAVGGQRTIWLVDGKNGSVIHSLAGNHGAVDYLEFSSKETLLCSAGSDDVAQVWDLGSLTDLSVLRGHKLWVNPVVVSPDGGRIASGSYDGTVRIWDAKTSQSISIIRIPSDLGANLAVTALAWSPDGGTIAAYHDRITLIEAATGNIRTMLDVPAQSTGTKGISFSPRGDRLIAARNSLAVWDARTMQPLSAPLGQDFVAFGQNGTLLATGGPDHSIRLMRSEDYSLIRVFGDHTEDISSAAFSPDGRHLATASLDHTVRIWEVNTGKPIAVLRDHTDMVYGVVFSPDGRRLATGGADNVIRLWDTGNWEEIARLRGHDNYVYSLVWTPDGKSIISGSGDHTVRIWDTQPIGTRLRKRHQRQSPSSEPVD